MGDLLNVYGLAIEHGLAVAVIAVLLLILGGYIARDWYRLRRLEQHVDTLETEFRTYITEQGQRCEVALTNSTTAITNSTTAITSMNSLARDFLNANRN